MTNIQIEILYEQPLKIQIEFPVAVLASLYGVSNLDKAWDDTVLYLITKVLCDHQVYIKSAKLVMEQKSEKSLGKISYQLILVAKPPLFDFNWLINSLNNTGLQRGLHLKLASKNGGFESRCQDEFDIDSEN